MIRYADLGAGKQLNEVVFAGSHDAGITTGGGNAQTQSLNILGQAQAGVRFFDLRVAAFATGNMSYGAKQVELKAFHADGKLHKQETKTRTLVGTDGPQALVRSKLRAGTEGLGLRGMLADARSFVTSANYSGEFLILKFDKCTNWPLIADTCREVLGNVIYTGNVNLNTATLGSLAGRVVCAFMPEGYAELRTDNQRAGIVPIVNLYKPPAGYRADQAGLQYWGAGGTSPFKPFFKIGQNVDNQSKILQKASTGVQVKKHFQFLRSVEYHNTPADPNAMGMMYWTTTGLFESIRDRNDSMWNLNNVGGLDSMWLKGFRQYADYFERALPQNIDRLSYGSGGLLKLFMPNLVMIDFASEAKCNYIYGLNTIAGSKLVDVTRRLHVG